MSVKKKHCGIKEEPLTISFETTELMRQWLENNYTLHEGIWLKVSKKGAPVTTINHQQALEVALCYGWIDGQANKLDDHFYLQKYTPRRPRSIWSKRNISIVEKLIAENKMHASGLLEIEKAKADGRWDNAYNSPANMTIPDDFMQLLMTNEQAYRFFKTLNKTNLFSIGFRLETAKRTETRNKRIKEIIEMLQREEKFH